MPKVPEEPNKPNELNKPNEPTEPNEPYVFTGTGFWCLILIIVMLQSFHGLFQTFCQFRHLLCPYHGASDCELEGRGVHQIYSIGWKGTQNWSKMLADIVESFLSSIQKPASLRIKWRHLKTQLVGLRRSFAILYSTWTKTSKYAFSCFPKR